MDGTQTIFLWATSSAPFGVMVHYSALPVRVVRLTQRQTSTLKSFCVADPLWLLSDLSPNRSLQSLEVLSSIKVFSVACKAVIFVPLSWAEGSAFLQLWWRWMTDFSLLIPPSPSLPPLRAVSIEYYFLKQEGERKKERMAYLQVIGGLASPPLVPCQNKRKKPEQHLTLLILL